MEPLVILCVLPEVVLQMSLFPASSIAMILSCYARMKELDDGNLGKETFAEYDLTNPSGPSKSSLS